MQVCSGRLMDNSRYIPDVLVTDTSPKSVGRNELEIVVGGSFSDA